MTAFFPRDSDGVEEETHPSSSVNTTGALRVGETLSRRFLVESLASRGGMGAIYRGLDLDTGQPVAIKTVASPDGDTSARFLREVKILAELCHPGIVRYLGHGATREGVTYLAMEWLDGEDLSAALARRTLSIDESITLVRRVCESLEEPHSRGVVHRDIKPGNLFLSQGDPNRVKVLDFGIARLTESASPHHQSTTGTLLGTVGYMAPEQAMCEKDVDPRADLFAVGCVLYECLTGKAPFASAHPVGVLAKVLREDPVRPSELRAGIPRWLDALVGRLLAKKREGRPKNARAVLNELVLRQAETIPGSRRVLAPTSEQRVVSVILGRPCVAPAEIHAPVTDDVVNELAVKFAADVAPLHGGALLFVLTGKSEANDRATHAALCALDLRRLRPDLTLAVATGLADTSARVPVGAAIDRAAALLGVRGDAGGGIFVDDVTSTLIGLRFEVHQSNGTTVLVGARREVDAPRVLMGRPTPCVGRDRELSMLEDLLDECVSDRVSRTVVVTGPPGIGKSRLAGEWLARGRHSRAVTTLFARADPGSAHSALSLVRRLIHDAAGLREADPVEVQLSTLRDYLAQGSEGPSATVFEFLAEVAGLMGDEEPTAEVVSARRTPDIMRERIRRALHGWLDDVTAHRAAVIVLDDLHWADSPSISLLAQILCERPQRPLMVLGLARPESERQFPALCEIASLRIRLTGLLARPARQLVHATLERELDDDVVERIIRTADGNPFYLEELIRRVASGGTEWPDTVLAMAQSRIERLDASERCALRAASVFGERVWDSGIAEMLDRDLDVRGLLESLARNEILVPAPESRYSGTHEYRFRHALLRDAAYAMMTDEDRRAGHGHAGRWLEAHGERDARVLADHYEAARDAERARPWFVRAAKAAIDAGDMVSTIDLANRGVRMGAVGLERGRLLLSRGYAESVRGKPKLDVVREALDLLTVGTAEWWLGLALVIFGSKADDAAPYVKLALEAPFASARDVPSGQGLITLVGGLVLLGKGDVADVIVERAECAAAADPEHDPVFHAFLALARCALGSVAPIRGKWRLEEAYREGRRAASALGKLGAVHGESIGLDYFAVACMHLGRYEEALQASLRSTELKRRAGTGINEGWSFLFQAKAYLRLQRPEDAIATVEEVASMQDPTVQQMLPVILAEAHLRQGDFAAAADEAAPACRGVSPRLRRLAACVRARALLSLGEPESALDTVERALEQHSHGLESDIELSVLRAEALDGCGRDAEAAEAIRRAAKYVQGLAADICDPELRASFLGSVEPCARTLSLWNGWTQRERL